MEGTKNHRGWTIRKTTRTVPRRAGKRAHVTGYTKKTVFSADLVYVSGGRVTVSNTTLKGLIAEIDSDIEAGYLKPTA